LVRLLLLTIVLYIAFLPLWWYSLEIIAHVIGLAANWIYSLFDPQVSIAPDGRVLRITVTTLKTGVAEPRSSALRLDTLTYGMPILAALVAATDANSIRSKIRSLIIGLGVMFVVSVPAVMASAKLTSLEVEELASGGDKSSALFDIMHGYAYSQPVVAVVIWWGLVMLGFFKEVPGQSSTAPIARNSPCSCGSGRKYKRCCGRPSS